MTTTPHAAWLPDRVLAPLGRGTAALLAPDLDAGPVLDAVAAELERATTAHGGRLTTRVGAHEVPDVVLATPAGLAELRHLAAARRAGGPGTADLSEEGCRVVAAEGTTVVVARTATGLLRGLFAVVRAGARRTDPAGTVTARDEVLEPASPLRVLDHWDNLVEHPVMGLVERGYAGASLFWADGRVREDLSRVVEYARLLASTGVNAVGLNNVNVHAVEARLLTDGLEDVARLADVFRPYGIRVLLSVSFAAPMGVGGLTTSDPLDEGVRRWWADRAAQVWARIPDFGGFVVKADSEGQPGPFAYGRTHADGANALARAVAPHGGTVFWRAFVYDHHQDWRDRSTDRARAAHDHFSPLDGEFDDHVVLQVKFGPMDFQVREPVSPVIAAMPRTRLAVELQVTQEYSGQQQHVCYLGEQWSEVLGWRPWGEEGATVADVVAGRGPGGRDAGLVAVSNVGRDEFWTGHPLAQANLYAFGRLASDPGLDPLELLDEWVGLTFGDDPGTAAALHELMDGSWRTYEDCTAPLGVGFMVRPGHHYGPDVDGYEYTPWGTYHFADRDGIGVDRARATGTGFTGQYPPPWRDVYESLADCPDELLLFFHHVPYEHVLRDGTTVVQHVYDTHFRGAERVEQMVRTWEGLRGRVEPDLHARVTERLAEQLRSAREWRDQLNTYFFRKSGVADAHGRTIH
ncbi:alpha-glucuronidase [uncultured Pseudokineococcus sp.]|uniref:alpha-glucuronidase n=1 Tax=uncultured Pseudokineococcus sp. TaxID=1642928 RepID=UPI00261482CB|nr:alpha-glucuronidase [uncultured Pseudokineococcus sp.]